MAVAVYTIIGWQERDADPLGNTDWTPELLQNQYLRLWLFWHRHLAAQTLIAVLVDAVATAQTHDCGIVLPEPLADAPPVRTSGQTCGAGKARPVGSIGRASWPFQRLTQMSVQATSWSSARAPSRTSSRPATRVLAEPITNRGQGRCLPFS